MDIHLTFRHMEPTEGLKTYTEQKAEKLLKYLLKPTKLNVVFSLIRFVHHVDLTLFEKQHIFKAKGVTNDMYASLDQAMHNLEEQLKRYKDRIKGHKNFFKTEEGKLREAADLFDQRLSRERISNRVWKKRSRVFKKKAA